MAVEATIANTLESFFSAGVVRKPLTDGRHKATIINFTLVPATQTSVNNDPYVRIDLVLEDGERPLNDNRFDQGFQIALSQLARQRGIVDTDISAPELMASLKGQQIDIWISHPIVNRRDGSQTRVRNISYLEPLSTEAATAANGASEQIQF